MAKRTVYHVVPTDKGWSLQAEGNTSDWKYFSTKSEAVDAGREEASQREPSQVIIHNEDGRIEEERTYGDDPRNIPG